MKKASKGNLLVVYAAHQTFTATVQEYLEAFATYSEFEIFYADGALDTQSDYDFERFDAILVTYSIRLCYETYISPHFAQKLAQYRGPKALTIQDEYENTELARQWIEKLGFDLVFTCVPDVYVEAIYPKSRFPKTKFVNVLTGYVPEKLVSWPRRPIAQRKKWIAYRGRSLHPVYGLLGLQKFKIGQVMKKACDDRKAPHDIAWGEGDRIYGDHWYEFLESARATLATESGSNIFDFDNSLRKRVDAKLSWSPKTPFEKIYNDFLKEHEGRVARMNQVSPKIFEAICMGTALVLLEGEYSGVVKPWEHYIPMRGDFSNVDEVMNALSDVGRLQEMADRAYRDVVESGYYSYRAFVRLVDSEIAPMVEKPRNPTPIMIAAMFRDERGFSYTTGHYHLLPTNRPLLPNEWAQMKKFQPPGTVVQLQMIPVEVEGRGLSFKSKKLVIGIARKIYQLVPSNIRRRWRSALEARIRRNWKYFEDIRMR